ncbi:archaemetzincin-2-like [Apostichopus japonicus]|uniref:archaemetzincin-2-like n=1 Tax=Stichopus japonicus TaxID=307972 RepID=UPI003AB43C10
MFCLSSNRGERRMRYLVGDVDEYDRNVRAIFEICEDCSLKEDKSKWKRLPRPSSLFVHLDDAPFCGRQTYKMWRASFDLTSAPFQKTDLNRPKKLHFLPLETFNIGNAKVGNQTFVQYICGFLKVFFSGLKVNFNDQFQVENIKPTERRHPVTERRQFLVTDFYDRLHRVTGIPRTDYILGLTWTDLYPSKDLNFVLGEASDQHKSGVFSFGRFEPQTFHRDQALDEDAELQLDGDIIWKMLRVATHETCHLFRLKHCVFFSCSMNASSSVTEAISQPLFLCPVCLRKLQKFLGFDIFKRYQRLLELCELLQGEYPSQNMESGITWLRQCLDFLSSMSVNS